MKQYQKKQWLIGVSALSIGVNLLLFAVKYYVGTADNSIALIADAWHTLSDSLSSLILMLCLQLATKPADGDHPFGHGRAEILASLTIGGMLLAVGVLLGFEGFEALYHQSHPNYSEWAIYVTIASIVVKELVAQISFYVAKKYNSSALKADGWHHRSDALTSLVVLIGIWLGQYFSWLDGVLGIGVGIVILFSAIEILKENINHFLGQDVRPELVEKASNICDNIAGTSVDVHHVHVHDYGEHKEMTLHARLPKHLSLIEAHDMVTEMERALANKLDVEVTIHMEPYLTAPD
ncbi:cation diffusion facilitator family transporter [Persicobacter psychrovividus]|uniref:Cobalt transporter n=1 Tax=Persicobacter psychrovividus TaxID=387638 RepID=A0ABM7VD31_9BACT|nr:cobalt transporter [Persicobacter psychrovividus]